MPGVNMNSIIVSDTIINSRAAKPDSCWFGVIRRTYGAQIEITLQIETKNECAVAVSDILCSSWVLDYLGVVHGEEIVLDVLLSSTITSSVPSVRLLFESVQVLKSWENASSDNVFIPFHWSRTWPANVSPSALTRMAAVLLNRSHVIDGSVIALPVFDTICVSDCFPGS